ncbi:hypothetical protein C7271_02865 [filamentous cyanobacterium CCP5]|nr:hypothetical protein C7271_02865 [filamentous cyanobacterium CCP5]
MPNCEKVLPESIWRDRLYCAENLVESASSVDWAKAVALTTTWPQPNTSYEESQALLKTASEQLLVEASSEAQAGRLDTAVDLASQIPLDTPMRQTAQELIFSWRQEWKAGTDLEQQIQSAIDQRSWETAREQLQAMQTLQLDYWLRDRHGYWQQQIQREQAAWDQLQQARELVATDTLEGLQEAIPLARQIPLDSQAWQQAKGDIDGWSQQLADIALDQWRRGHLAVATVMAQSLPPGLSYSSQTQELIQFSYAQKLAQQAEATAPDYQPRYGDLFKLMEAIRAAEQIPADSQFFSEAQSYIQDWQAQLQDLIRLRSAHTIARIGYAPAFRLAAAQAQQISPDRPRRLQGQTLVAHWRNEIQRLQDRPILREADRLAQLGSIPDLQAAIAKAGEVDLGRALRVEAQTRIADWRNEIQVIEDRPILDEANTLAREDRLQEAIQVARRIPEGRVLYARAQGLIADWTAQIQIAEDQPILNEAKDLAYIGSLTRAINLASQIAPGRALYGQAQSAIAIWKAERAYIESIRAAEARTSSGENSADSAGAAEDSSESP